MRSKNLLDTIFVFFSIFVLMLSGPDEVDSLSWSMREAIPSTVRAIGCINAQS